MIKEKTPSAETQNRREQPEGKLFLDVLCVSALGVLGGWRYPDRGGTKVR
jgi:hypothetical protein